MKTMILILIAMIFVSCKEGTNKTATTQNVSAYDRRAFLEMPHNGDSSLLREKLLNLKLSSILNQQTPIEIQNGDQFKFTSEAFQINRNEQLEYEKLKSTSVEIVVSFSDRTEIYFVPTGITREQALFDLHLNKEGEEELDWEKDTPNILLKGQTYYLLSFTKDDLLKNDQNFFSKKMEMSADTKAQYHFSRFQKIVIHFQIDYFAKETAAVSIGTRRVSCTRDMREAGMCDPCTAMIERATGRLTKTNWDLNSFGLALLINGKEYSVSDLAPTLSADKQTVTITIDLSRLSVPDNVTVQFIEPRVTSLIKSVSAYGYEGNCPGGPFPGATLDLTPIINMTYQIDIYGRELKI